MKLSLDSNTPVSYFLLVYTPTTLQGGSKMAHLTKYTKGQLPHLLKHDSRAKDARGQYIKFGNQEIDTSRTKFNYNLHERNDGLSDYEYIKQRGEKYPKMSSELEDIRNDKSLFGGQQEQEYER